MIRINIALAQNNSNDTIPTIAKHALYFEYGGNGPVTSINYERMLFIKNNFKTNLRVGLGIDFIKRKFKNLIIPSIPMEINGMLGKSKHYFEIGIGITPFFSPIPSYNYVIDDNDISGLSQAKLNVLMLLRIGYRHQKLKRGWFYRIAYTPILMNTSSRLYYSSFPQSILVYYPSFGISIGKSF